MMKAAAASIDDVSDELEKIWRDKAGQQLHTSKQAYLDGLSFHTSGDEVQVTVDGGLATAVETGSERFDLKPGFLGSATSRVIPIGGGFKTVSAKSDGWWHPGIQARDIGTQVIDELEDHTDIAEIVADNLSRQNV